MSPLPSLKKRTIRKISSTTHMCAMPVPTAYRFNNLYTFVCLLRPHSAAHVSVIVAGGNCEENIIKHETTDCIPGCSIYRFGSTVHRNKNAHGRGSVRNRCISLETYLHKWKRPYWLPLLAACQCLVYQCWWLLTCHTDHNTMQPACTIVWIC